MKSASLLVLAAAVALASFAATGCAGAPPQAVVRARAASDLACPDSRALTADSARWTSDLASDLKIGAKSDVDSDGIQKIEVGYTRGSDDTSAMVITVDTKNLCVTWAEGGHL